MFAEKNKTGNPFTFRAPEGTPYVKLSEYAEHAGDHPGVVRGWYFTKGKYGEQVSLVMDDCIVNMPKHMVDTFKEIQTHPEEIAAVNDGHLGIEPYTYTDVNGKDQWSVRLTDI